MDSLSYLQYDLHNFSYSLMLDSKVGIAFSKKCFNFISIMSLLSSFEMYVCKSEAFSLK